MSAPFSCPHHTIIRERQAQFNNRRVNRRLLTSPQQLRCNRGSWGGRVGGDLWEVSEEGNVFGGIGGGGS